MSTPPKVKYLIVGVDSVGSGKMESTPFSGGTAFSEAVKQLMAHKRWFEENQYNTQWLNQAKDGLTWLRATKGEIVVNLRIVKPQSEESSLKEIRDYDNRKASRKPRKVLKSRRVGRKL